MRKLMMFVPITKVDAAKRLVSGVLAAEARDASNEIMDYEASKAAFTSWSEKFSKLTDGKSVGNLRAMHKAVSAGKFTEINLNDTEKRVEVTAKVVDDAEWKKVQEGVYTGFSIGGKYGWKKQDGDVLRYQVASMVEGSLVDAPCIPTAVIDSVKAAGFSYIGTDGSTEIRKFKAVGFIAKFRAAHEAIVAGTEKLAKAVQEIAASGGLKKSMWDVADLACALASINRIRMYLKSEAAYEGDGSDIPERLRTWIDTGALLLADLLAEEAAELTEDEPLNDEMVALAATVQDLQKTVSELSSKITTPPPAKAPGGTGVADDGGAVKKGAIPTNEVDAMDEKKMLETINKGMGEALTKFDATLNKINDSLAKQDEVNKTTAETLKDQSEAISTIAKVIEALAGKAAPTKGVANATVAIGKANDVPITGGTLPASGAAAEEPKDVHGSMLKALSAENARAVDPSDPRHPDRTR